MVVDAFHVIAELGFVGETSDVADALILQFLPELCVEHVLGASELLADEGGPPRGFLWVFDGPVSAEADRLHALVHVRHLVVEVEPGGVRGSNLNKVLIFILFIIG